MNTQNQKYNLLSVDELAELLAYHNPITSEMPLNADQLCLKPPSWAGLCPGGWGWGARETGMGVWGGVGSRPG